MRAFARFIVNFVILGATFVALAELPRVKAYQHASHDMKIAVPVAIVVVMFGLACFVLGKVIPAKKKTPQRQSYSYTAPAGRR
jgi:fumarate reductase subunit D